MADSTIEFGNGTGQPWGSLSSGTAHRSGGDSMARTRALLDAGRLPARADDDRTLARMLGVALLTGLAMTGGTIYGLVHLLT